MASFLARPVPRHADIAAIAAPDVGLLVRGASGTRYGPAVGSVVKARRAVGGRRGTRRQTGRSGRAPGRPSRRDQADAGRQDESHPNAQRLRKLFHPTSTVGVSAPKTLAARGWLVKLFP